MCSLKLLKQQQTGKDTNTQCILEFLCLGYLVLEVLGNLTEEWYSKKEEKYHHYVLKQTTYLSREFLSFMCYLQQNKKQTLEPRAVNIATTSNHYLSYSIVIYSYSSFTNWIAVKLAIELLSRLSRAQKSANKLTGALLTLNSAKTKVSYPPLGAARRFQVPKGSPTAE